MPLKAILNSLIAGMVSCIFAIGFKYFGIYLIFLSYFSALPIFISGLYFGITGIFVSAIFSIVIMTFVSSFNVGILFFITNILPITLILFERSKNKFNYLNFISKLTLISSILYIVINYFYRDKIKNITNNFTEYLNQSLNNSVIIDQSILDLAPSIMIFSWNLILIINLICARFIVAKYFKKPINLKDKLIDLKLQRWLIFLFILFLIPASLLSNDNGIWFRSLALIYAIPLTIQGFGVVQVFFKQKKISDVLIYSFYTIIFLIPISLPIITAIGVIEYFYDFRQLKYKKN